MTDRMTDAELAEFQANVIAAHPAVAVQEEVKALRAELARLMACVHQPAPEQKPDYWHVSAGQHTAFGQVVSAIAALATPPAPQDEPTPRALQDDEIMLDNGNILFGIPKPATVTVPRDEWLRVLDDAEANLVALDLLRGEFEADKAERARIAAMRKLAEG